MLLRPLKKIGITGAPVRRTSLATIGLQGGSTISRVRGLKLATSPAGKIPSTPPFFQMPQTLPERSKIRRCRLLAVERIDEDELLAQLGDLAEHVVGHDLHVIADRA